MSVERQAQASMSFFFLLKVCKSLTIQAAGSPINTWHCLCYLLAIWLIFLDQTKLILIKSASSYSPLCMSGCLISIRQVNELTIRTKMFCSLQLNELIRDCRKLYSHGFFTCTQVQFLRRVIVRISSLLVHKLVATR